jgi:hypothetical protein
LTLAGQRLHCYTDYQDNATLWEGNNGRNRQHR